MERPQRTWNQKFNPNSSGREVRRAHRHPTGTMLEERETMLNFFGIHVDEPADEIWVLTKNSWHRKRAKLTLDKYPLPYYDHSQLLHSRPSGPSCGWGHCCWICPSWSSEGTYHPLSSRRDSDRATLRRDSNGRTSNPWHPSPLLPPPQPHCLCFAELPHPKTHRR